MMGRIPILTGALVLRAKMAAAVAAREALCRVLPAFSLTWIKENMPVPITGGRRERLHQPLR